MSSTRYLEFDSSFRNRNLYPNPASFAIDIAQSGAKNSRNAVDPVSIEAPIMSLNNLFTTFETIAYGNITTSPISYSNTTLSFTLSIENIIKINGYYEGAVMTHFGEKRRIAEYYYISGNIGYFRMDTQFSVMPTNISINNATDIAVGSFFIPNGPVFTDNAYYNWYIHNITTSLRNNRNEYVTITYYNALNKMASFVPPLINDWDPSCDNIVLRQQTPLVISSAITMNKSDIILQQKNMVGNLSNTIDEYVGSFFSIIYTKPCPMKTVLKGYINVPNTLVVTSITNYIIYTGMTIIGINIPDNTFIIEQLSGTSGGIGNYQLFNSIIPIISTTPNSIIGYFKEPYTIEVICNTSTNILDVQSVTSPSIIQIGGLVTDLYGNTSIITEQLTGAPPGGIGTYQLNSSLNISLNDTIKISYTPPFTTVFIATCTGNNIITVSQIYSSIIYIGMNISSQDITGNVTILKQLTGSTGNIGTYIISSIQTITTTYRIIGNIITPMLDKSTAVGKNIPFTGPSDYIGKITSYNNIRIPITSSFTCNTISGSTVLDITAINNGVGIVLDMSISGSGINITNIISQLSGTKGGIGSYIMSDVQSATATNLSVIGVISQPSYKLTVCPSFPDGFDYTNPYYTYEIYNFTKDNCVPFNYTGSVISQQEQVCYQVDLLNLILPNVLLALNPGSRITFYPYVYVELVNVGTGANRNIIYSNNPNSTKMLFRCPINDVPNPIFSSFVKIDGDGMSQTIKFKPNDNFFFAVYLGNGNVFETLLKDNFSPLPPKGFLQISASFAFKRL
jgi:hypothetical protein